MPTMPYLMGLQLPAAQKALQAAGVLIPASLGYFDVWPITVQWLSKKSFDALLTADSSLVTADSTLVTADAGTSLPMLGGDVTTQSVPVGTSVAANIPITLRVLEFSMGVAYP